MGTGVGTGVITSTADGTYTGADTTTGAMTTTHVVTSTSVGSAYPACVPTPDVNVNYAAAARVFIELNGPQLETSTFAGLVSVDGVWCQQPDDDDEAPCVPGRLQHVTLVSVEHATLELRISHPELPVDFFQAGETLQLDLFAWPYTNFFGTTTCQNVELSRSGVPILIAHSCLAPSQSASAPSPAKGVPAGVTVGELALSDAGVSCAVANGGFCDYWYHSAKVQLAGVEVGVEHGATRSVGGYAFTLSRYRDAVDTGACDSPSEVQFIAIRP
jgi:hypothetical protein